jgi:transposase
MRAMPLGLREGDREQLMAWTRASTVRAGLAQRARIVLLAADGVCHTEIAERMQVSRQTVITWRGRYERSGLVGMADRPRSGRPRTVDRAAIITATLRPPPKKLGVTHWSSRLLAERLGVDHATVARAWTEYGVAPWRCETFKFSTDPELIAKVTDVVGLYLAPPDNAIVLCVDEKSQIQALDRTAPTLPMQPGRAASWTHDYRRHSHHDSVRGVGDSDREGNRGVQASASTPGVLGLLQTGRPRLPRGRVAPGHGQLRRAQARRDP